MRAPLLSHSLTTIWPRLSYLPKPLPDESRYWWIVILVSIVFYFVHAVMMSLEILNSHLDVCVGVHF